MEESPTEILQNVIESAENRRYSERTLVAYRRTWRELTKWLVREELSVANIPAKLAASFYRVLTDGRSPSHHLQVRAALAFYFKVITSSNPFADCVAPKFEADKLEIQYLTGAELGALFRTWRDSPRDYFGSLAYHLSLALLHTACRFDEWANLTRDRLLRCSSGKFDRVRIRGKGEKYTDLPISDSLAECLADWISVLNDVQSVKVRRKDFVFANSPLVFPGRGGAAVTNQAFNARLRKACLKASVPVITAHGLRHSAATMLLNERGRNLKEVQTLLRHKSISTTARYTAIESQRLRGIVQDLGVFL